MKNSIRIPDKDNKIFKWIYSSNIAHTRWSSHVKDNNTQSTRLRLNMGVGIDYDNSWYTKNIVLPYGEELTTILVHQIKVDGKDELFIKLEEHGFRDMVWL